MASDKDQRRVTAQKAVFGGVGLMLVGGVVSLATAGTPGGISLVTRVGITILSLGFGVIGTTLVAFRTEIAAIEARYNYGEGGTAAIGVVFLGAAVVFVLEFVIAPA